MAKRGESLDTYSGILLEFQKDSETEVIVLPTKCLCGQAKKQNKKKATKECKSGGGERLKRLVSPNIKMVNAE